MAITTDDLKAQLSDVDEGDEAMLPRILAAALAYVERILGFKLTDTDELPDGPPADLEHAVLMLAAEWYENREATITGTIIAQIPIGVAQILAEHRRYTFG